LFSIIFGITLEFLQYLLPFGRYFDFYDILANMAGVIIGIIILLFYKKKLL
jgi:glycopeptide antibiotics resistance protein